MKLCLAGWDCEPVGRAELIKNKCKYFLGSYYYLKSLDEAEFEKVLKIKKFLIVDSGAHTLQKDKNNVDFDKFVFDYAQWLKKYINLIDEYVELDIENKVGLKQVEKWREYLEKEVGKKPIVVWHRERGKQYWLGMVKRYPYVGFSGFVTVNGKPEVPERYIGWFIQTAHDAGAKIHGFGLTRSKLLRKYPFDSVDSSSWKSTARFGHFHYFENGEIKSKNNYTRKDGYKADHRVRLKQSAIAWLKMQEFIEEYWEDRLKRR